MYYGKNNSQPSDNGSTRRYDPSRAQLEDSLHWARKKEERVWGSGEHEAARAEVQRLEAAILKTTNKK
jgi:hypothetical protein